MEKFAGLKMVACADMRADAAQAQAAAHGIEALGIDQILARPDIDISSISPRRMPISM